jgi:integrase
MTCAYETGMRSREITELTWDKVDMKAGVMRLGTVDTKTKHKRIIPISPTLRTVLTEIRLNQRQGKVASISGHVFTWKGKAFSRQGWKRSWKTACGKASLVGLHFHDLRHTFVTRKVREGWDYKRIMAITGHKTFSVFQRYNNPSEDDIKEVVSASRPKRTPAEHICWQTTYESFHTYPASRAKSLNQKGKENAPWKIRTSDLQIRSAMVHLLLRVIKDHRGTLRR